MYETHLAIVPVFQRVDNTIYPLDKSLSTVYYYFIFCTVIILKKLKSKYIVLVMATSRQVTLLTGLYNHVVLQENLRRWCQKNIPVGKKQCQALCYCVCCVGSIWAVIRFVINTVQWQWYLELYYIPSRLVYSQVVLYFNCDIIFNTSFHLF